MVQTKLIPLSLVLVFVAACPAPARGEQPDDGIRASCSSLIHSATRHLNDLAAQILLSKIGYQGTREISDPIKPKDVRVLLDSPDDSILQLRAISVKPRADAPGILEWEAELEIVGAIGARHHDCEIQNFSIRTDEKTGKTAAYRGGALMKPQGLERETVWIRTESRGSEFQSPTWITWVLIARDSDTEPLRLLGAYTLWVSPHH